MVRETLPFDPRRDTMVRDASTVARLGRWVIARAAGLGGLLDTLGSALLAARGPGAAASRVVREVVITQILYTGVHALGLVSLIAFMIGGTIVIQTTLMAPMTNGEVMGRVMVAVVLRELAPLGTAIVVAGRSGTAIATELGNMKASSEILALSSLGIDPARLVVWPRIAGALVSVGVLTVYFAAVALLGGWGVGTVIASPSLGSLRTGFAEALLAADLPLFLVKSAGLGLLVGWLPCHFGLQVKSSPTEVPRQSSRAVTYTLLSCVAFDLGVTAFFYSWVGPPLPY